MKYFISSFVRAWVHLGKRARILKCSEILSRHSYKFLIYKFNMKTAQHF